MPEDMEISLEVDVYKEGDTFIAYSPALRLSTYADNIEKLKERFSHLVDIFFDELEEMGTTEEVLLECGWTKITKPFKRWVPPTPIAKMEEEVKIPCPA